MYVYGNGYEQLLSCFVSVYNLLGRVLMCFVRESS